MRSSLTAGRGDADLDLVLAARDGDDRAFGILFDRWFDRVHSLAWTILRDRDAAADVAQETFLTAWRRLASLREPAAFGGWLLRIARNGALDRVTRDRRDVALGDEETAMEIDRRNAGTDTTAAGAEQADQADLVWAAAAALGPRDASVLDLHLRHGLGPAEIAVALDVTPNNAHQLLFRLRSRLGDAVRARVLWRAGRPRCTDLARALDAAGLSRFGPEVVGVTRRHLKRCARCTEQERGHLAPAAMFAAVPLVAAPTVLKTQAAAALSAQGVPMAGSSWFGATSAAAPVGPGQGGTDLADAHRSGHGDGGPDLADAHRSGHGDGGPGLADAQGPGGGRGGTDLTGPESPGAGAIPTAEPSVAEGSVATGSPTPTTGRRGWGRAAALVGSAAAVTLLVTLLRAGPWDGHGTDRTAVPPTTTVAPAARAGAATTTSTTVSPTTTVAPAVPEPPPVAEVPTTTTTSTPRPAAPTIQRFAATAQDGPSPCPSTTAGRGYRLLWSSTGADTATIAGTVEPLGPIGPDGSLEACAHTPAGATATFELTVTGPGGRATATATATATTPVPPSRPDGPSLGPTTLSDG
ncbi:MAG: RNA polymerase sigma factor [Acidimicrobiia bacterium]